MLADTIANVNAQGEVNANTGSDAGILAVGAVAAIGLGGAVRLPPHAHGSLTDTASARRF